MLGVMLSFEWWKTFYQIFNEEPVIINTLSMSRRFYIISASYKAPVFNFKNRSLGISTKKTNYFLRATSTTRLLMQWSKVKKQC